MLDKTFHRLVSFEMTPAWSELIHVSGEMRDRLWGDEWGGTLRGEGESLCSINYPRINLLAFLSS